MGDVLLELDERRRASLGKIGDPSAQSVLEDVVDNDPDMLAMIASSAALTISSSATNTRR